MTDDEDDFFKFRRSSTKKPKDTEAQGSAANEPEVAGPADPDAPGAEAEVEELMSHSQSVDTKKRKGSPVKPPLSKRSVPKRASVFDHLQSVVQDGMHVEDVTKLLRAYIRALGHRKGLILACKDVKLFIEELEENGGEDDIMDIASNYNIALCKLPAILE